jgi:uncharacterized protein YciI
MFFFVISRDRVSPKEIADGLDAHFAWLKDQHESGALLLSGPARQRGYGMLLFRAASREELDRIIATDPNIVSGMRTSEVHDWEVHHAFGIGPFSKAQTAALRAAQAPSGGS